jgi:conjugation system TraG family ATPase
VKVAFNDILPISYIEGNVIVTKYGDVAACFAFQGKEVFSQDKNQFMDSNEFLTTAYSFLDDASFVIQKQEVFLETTYVPPAEMENDTYMSKAFLAHFKGKKYFKHYSYVYLIKTDVLSISRNYDTTVRPGEKAKTISADLDEFKTTIDHFKSHLSKNGFKLVDLNQEQLEKVVEGYFSFFETDVISDIQFSPQFKIGDKFAEIYSLNDDSNQPEKVSPFSINSDYSTDDNKVHSDFLYALGPGLKCDHILNQFIFLDGQRYWTEQLNRKNKDLKSMKSMSPGNEKLAADHLRFLEDTINADGVKKVCRYHMNVIFWGDTVERLTSLKGAVKGRFIELGITPHAANYLDLKKLFLASSPGNGGTMPKEETIITHTDHASCFLLKESVIDRSKGKPSTHGIQFVDRMSNIPMYRDMWFEPYRNKLIDNRNGLVIGKSGGGKSSTTIEVLRQFYEMGFLITTIDIGGSFELLAKEYNGNYITYQPGMSLGINPFQVLDGVMTVEHLEYLATFIQVLWKPKEALEDEKRAALEKVIIAAYQGEKRDNGDYQVKVDGISADIAWFYKWVDAHKEAIREITRGNESYFDINSFLVSLEQFVNGKFSNLFILKEGQNNVDPSKRLTIFELNNIKDHPTLFPIFALLIDYLSTNVLWKNAKAQKIFLYDEAHKILEKPGMAVQLRFQYKTYRKYDAGVWICIQQISDIDVEQGNIAEAILGNSDIKLLMRHAKDLIPAISNRLMLTKHQESLLRSINNNFNGKYAYTEHLSILGADMKVVRTMVSPAQRVIMTSEFSEKSTLYKLVEQEGDWYKGVEAYIKHKNWA